MGPTSKEKEKKIIKVKNLKEEKLRNGQRLLKHFFFQFFFSSFNSFSDSRVSDRQNSSG